jgi:SecD/SecF fusion protein
MKSYLSRVILCLVPVVLSAFVVGWAYARYNRGEGGFRLGPDLSGGTILVYEVDPTKQGAGEYKADELAAALKRRIDPADLYNVTIRPVAGNPPRVEIVLPTGGLQQQNIQVEAWHQLINDVKAKWPPPENAANVYDGITIGQRQLLQAKISELYPKEEPKTISDFISEHYKTASGRRALTTEEVENIKALIAQQGRLEFRILANSTDDADAIARAKAYFTSGDHAKELERLAYLGEPPPSPRAEDGGTTFPVKLADGELINYGYRWVELGKQELYTLRLTNADADKNPLITQARDKGEAFTLPWAPELLFYTRKIPNPDRIPPQDRQLGKKYEYFILTRNSEPGKEVTGDYLSAATVGTNERGDYAVHFAFNTEGANLFYELTNRNKPTGNFQRRLAIVLDGTIRSAPGLRSAIRSRGEISGGFTLKEVQQLVTILRAGALPATLKPNPVRENTMGATLGQDTIVKGTWSVVFAFLAVVVFMLIYYRFAGVVACIALLANLLLTVAFMVLVNATFTLPGLAGLVLMLGMAVDANVLIYERLREERERGASLALAIRNGYDRAFPTIIDTHLSSIFTAIVLYIVGNDQLKGFGISLTVGLIISLFTSLYMTRTMFDLWLSRNWLHKLKMMQLFHRPNIDFMAIRYYWFTATLVLTLLGAGLFFWRLTPTAPGGTVLDIDFVGGTAYTGELTKPMTIGELREELRNSKLPDLSVVQIFPLTRDPNDPAGTSRFFTVRTSEKNPREVLQDISTLLGTKLKKIELGKFEIAENNQSATLHFIDPTTGEPGYASRAQLTRLLTEEFEKYHLNVGGFRVDPASDEHQGRFSVLRLELTDPMDRATLENLLKETREQFAAYPQPEGLENFDPASAASTQERALYAILASWAALLLFLWFRHGNWTFGLATVLCLVHDLFFTLGIIAACTFVHGTWFGNLLGISDFKLDLNSVAALLTLVGYSVSDTIVVFDRIREVRGKNPVLTSQMINDSVNQTLSRTILSSLTVWLVVIVLYAFGGEGVHLFSFVMIVGVIVGTYSSIYIASPLLLMFGEGRVHARDRGHVAIQPAPAQG